MNRSLTLFGVIFVLLASACGPQATPTADPLDIQHTAEAAAFTMVAETEQALPTATRVPPTEFPSPTSPPTVTPLPLPTSSTPGLTPAGLPTFTQQVLQPAATSNSGGDQANCNQPLTSWQGPTANFSVANVTKPQGTIVLSMYVVTDLNQCGYLIITGDSFSGPVGNYSAGAFITGKENHKAFGSFRITQGNWKIVVRNESIEAEGGCFPNC